MLELDRPYFRTSAVVMLVAYFSVGCTQPISTEEAMVFFDQYADLERRQSPDITQLFSDDAIVSLSRRSLPGGASQSLTISGAEWKATIRDALEYDRIDGDYDSFSHTTVEIDGNKAIIRAERYSNLRCYYDDEFYLVVWKSQTGDLEIIEMRADTQAESDC